MGERALNSPVRRIDVLERVKAKVKAFDVLTRFGGLCPLLWSVIRLYGLYDGKCCPDIMSVIRFFFPLYTFGNAVRFGAEREEYMNCIYWWTPYKWNEKGGRMRFLNWLIEQYKDDDTDLRTIV